MGESRMEYNKEMRQISSISRITKDHSKPNKVLTPDQIKTNDHILRIALSLISFGIAISWLAFVGYLIWKFLKLDPYNTKVMIVLLTTTTITVVGLPSLVLQGIYKVLQEENKALELKNKLNNQ